MPTGTLEEIMNERQAVRDVARGLGWLSRFKTGRRIIVGFVLVVAFMTLASCTAAVLQSL